MTACQTLRTTTVGAARRRWGATQLAHVNANAFEFKRFRISPIALPFALTVFRLISPLVSSLFPLVSLVSLLP